MSIWTACWFGPVEPVRIAALRTGLLTLVALDVFTLMLRRTSLLGIGGFNVSHVSAFRWLADLGQPAVVAALLVASALVALVVAWAGTFRALAATLFAGFTLAWLTTRLDSYQHHYLLSLLLLCAVFLPDPRASDAVERREEAGPAWAFVLIGATCGLVYLWAAVAKLEPQWLSGAALHALVSPEQLERLLVIPAALGLDEADATRWAARAVVGGEFGLAAAYLAAPWLVRPGAPRAHRLAVCAWVLAVVLHGSVELLNLRIGWFSYYMIGLASVFLLPVPLLRRVAAPALAPVSLLERGAEWAAARAGSRLGLVAAAAGAAAVLAAAAGAGIPGARAGAGVASLLVLATVAWLIARRPAAAWRAALSLFVAAGIMATCLAWTDVRFAYHYERAVTLARIGQPEAALAGYRLAERYGEASRLHVPIGRTLRTLGRDEEAAARYRMALEVDPDDADAHNDLGVIRQRAGDLRGATRAYGRALRSEPDHPEARANLGMALWLAGDVEGALFHFREAVRSRPDWPPALTGTAWLLLTRRTPLRADVDEALLLAERARTQTRGSSPAVLEALAAAYSMQGRFEQAADTIGEALALADSGATDPLDASWAETATADLARYRRGRMCGRCSAPPPGAPR